MSRLQEELDKSLKIIQTLTEQRDDARRRENFANVEYHKVEQRLAALGTEKSLLVVWPTDQAPEIALDGNWSMSDAKRLLRPLGRAVRFHQDQIRRKFLTKHGFAVDPIQRPKSCPSGLLKKQIPDSGANLDSPSRLPQQPHLQPQQEVSELDELPMEEETPLDEKTLEEETPPEPEPKGHKDAGWVDVPFDMADVDKKHKQAMHLAELRYKQKEKRRKASEAEAARIKAIVSSEDNLATPGRDAK